MGRRLMGVPGEEEEHLGEYEANVLAQSSRKVAK